MRVRRLKQVTVRGGHPWAGDVVDATFTADGDRVDLVAADGQTSSIELVGPPIDVRWGYVLTVTGAERTVQLVQCAECAERKENPSGREGVGLGRRGLVDHHPGGNGRRW